jgi:hypothetical protein
MVGCLYAVYKIQGATNGDANSLDSNENDEKHMVVMSRSSLDPRPDICLPVFQFSEPFPSCRTSRIDMLFINGSPDTFGPSDMFPDSFP